MAFTCCATRAHAADKITFDDHILPIFRNSCNNCHNADRKKGDLDLSSYTATMVGGGTGAVLAAGDATGSKLYAVVVHAETPTMPPKRDKLPEKELDLIKRWIEGGMPENSGSKVVIKKKPKLDLVVDAEALGKPPAEPAMPQNLRLDPIVLPTRGSAVFSIANSPWAPVVAVGGHKQVILYDSDTRELVGVLPFEESFAHIVRFSRDGRILLAGGGRGGAEGFVQLFDVKTGRMLARVGDEYDSVLAADISADMKYIALGGPGKLVKVHRVSDGQKLHAIEKHTDWITAVAYSGDAKLLATGDRQGNLHVWEADAGGSAAAMFDLRGHRGAITAVSFRVDSKVLASASEDGTARLWNMNDGKLIRQWTAHGGGVLDLSFARDGKIITAGRDKHIKIWKADGSPIRSIAASDDIVTAASFNHDATVGFSGDFHGRIRTWNLADGKQLAEVEASPPPLGEQIERTTKQLTEARDAATKAKAAADAAAKRLTDCQATIRNATEQLATAGKQLAEAEKKLPQVRSQRDQARREMQQADQQVRNGQRAVQQRTSEFDRAHKHHQQRNEERVRMAAALQTARERHASAEKQAVEAEAAAKNAPGDQNLANRAKQLRRAAASAKSEMDRAASRDERAIAQVEEAKQRLAKANEAIKQAKERLVTADSAKSNASDELKRIEAQLKQVEQSIPNLRRQIDAARRLKSDSEKVLPNSQAASVKAAATFDDAAARAGRIEQSLNRLKVARKRSFGTKRKR